MLENQLKQYIYEHERLMDGLLSVRKLELPQCYIGAGYIRNYVWDRLHGYPLHRSTEDALSKWPETATAIGSRIDNNGQLHFCHPYGLADLFHLFVKRSPLFLDQSYFLQRLETKNWKKEWPRLTIIKD